MWSTATHRLIELALEEDLGPVGDVTSRLLPDPDTAALATVVLRQEGVACGVELLPLLLELAGRRLGAELRAEAILAVDGAVLPAGRPLARLGGPLSAMLSAERTLLNFLGRLCGVATLTRRFVAAARAGHPDVQVLDTRKTLPGWRELDKYAVRCGGGANHRRGLFDAALLKDNHLAGVPVAALADYLTELLSRLDRRGLAFVEVEVDSLAQLEQVLRVTGVDIVLLDNFAPDALREAVRMRDAAGLRGRAKLEASGGITLDTIAQVAATGVERISVGAITHSAANLDLALDR